MATIPPVTGSQNLSSKASPDDWILETQTPGPDGKAAQHNLPLDSGQAHTLVVQSGVQFKLIPAVTPVKDQSPPLALVGSVSHAKKGLDLQLMLPGGGSLVLLDFYAANAKAAPTKLQVTQLDGKEESVFSSLPKEAPATAEASVQGGDSKSSASPASSAVEPLPADQAALKAVKDGGKSKSKGKKITDDDSSWLGGFDGSWLGLLALGGLGGGGGGGSSGAGAGTGTGTLTISGSVTGIAKGPVLFTLDFSEPVRNFNLSKLSLTGGTASSFQQVGANQYTVVVTPNANSTSDIVLTVAQGSVLDLAGNALASTVSVTQNVDTSPPDAPTLALGSGVNDGASSAEASAGGGVVTVANTSYQYQKFTFTANGASTTIRFVETVDQPSNEIHLDTVVVTRQDSNYTLGTTTPLVLDLNGDGIHTSPLNRGVLFDTNSTGQVKPTGWTDNHDGLLALDLNGDGKINDGAELFGSGTSTPNGKAIDGYTALAQYDLNADRVIDTKDAVFAKLRVWVDSNVDAVTDAGELHSLTGLGIASLNLQAVAGTHIDNGNTLGLTSNWTGADGQQHAMADVFFASTSLQDLVQQATAKLDLDADPAANVQNVHLADVLATDQKLMVIKTGSNDVVNLDLSGWSNSGTTTAADSHTYALWNNGAAHLLIDQNASVYQVL